MEEWNIGMMKKNEVLKPIIPSFHYSNIPVVRIPGHPRPRSRCASQTAQADYRIADDHEDQDGDQGGQIDGHPGQGQELPDLLQEWVGEAKEETGNGNSGVGTYPGQDGPDDYHPNVDGEKKLDDLDQEVHPYISSFLLPILISKGC
jgi:hypothetical protein